MKDTRTRSVLKALSYRIWASITTGLIVAFIFGKWELAVFTGLADFVSKIALYFIHERIWDRIKFGRRRPRGMVIWFTGLPGSGKTTLALAVEKVLRARQLPVESLDGDSIRAHFPKVGFSRPEREEHIRRVGHLASRLQDHGVNVVASLISPFEESRSFVRQLCGDFIEVYLATPLEVCEQRDPKGNYRKARAGEIVGFTGVDDIYEPPNNAELIIDTSQLSVEDAVKQIIRQFDVRM